MARTVTVVGLPKMQAALLRKSAAARAAAAAVVAAETSRVWAEAKANAPVRDGVLRDGIHSRVGGLSGTVATSARHSGFMEFGTYKDQAQPYMRPAAETSRRRFPTAARAVIGAAVKRG